MCNGVRKNQYVVLAKKSDSKSLKIEPRRWTRGTYTRRWIGGPWLPMYMSACVGFFDRQTHRWHSVSLARMRGLGNRGDLFDMFDVKGPTEVDLG